VSADPAQARPSLPSLTVGRSRSLTRAAREHWWPAVSLAAAGLAVLSQVAYPLLDGGRLTAVTVASVLAFVTASIGHAGWAFGARAAAVTGLCAGGLGLLAESVGVATGFPFGSYRYASSLGPALMGVPLVVPLAWAMMAYPAVLLARRLVAGQPGLRLP
jgi:uncharacterized membrane protein